LQPRQWHFFNTAAVSRRLASANTWVKQEYATLLEQLATDPRGGAPGILTAKRWPDPSLFSAPFDDGLVLYQVMADQPLVKLIDVLFLS